LNSASDAKIKAHLLLFALSESGAWLGTLPVPSLGTKLDDESLRIAFDSRLSVPIVVVFVVLMLMFLVLMVCLAGVMAAVSTAHCCQ